MSHPPPCPVVIDTNIALDILLFHHPDTIALHTALVQQRLRWIGTMRMRDEWQHVLAYPHLARHLQQRGVDTPTLLAQRDALCHTLPDAPRCIFVCKDTDDQCFVDLAAAHGACLLSKDRQVLRLRKRLARLGVPVCSIWTDAQA